MTATTNRLYPLFELDEFVRDAGPFLLQALEMVDGDMGALFEAINGLAPTRHVHEIADITDLPARLDGKADKDHDHTLGGLSNVADNADTAPTGSVLWKSAIGWAVGNPATILGVHQHTMANVEGLDAALAGKATPADIAAAIRAFVGAAPEQLDTILELATALGNDANFAATITAALGQRVRVDATMSLSAAQQKQAQTNIGLARTLPVAATTAASTVDLNTLTTPGFDPLLHRGTQPNGWGTDTGGFVLVIAYGTTQLTQFVFPYTGGGVRFRDLFSGTWTSWKLMAHIITSTAAPSGPMSPGEIWIQVDP